MGKQRHDQGYKKNRLSPQPEPMEDTNELAKKLVRQGLASKNILERKFTAYTK